MNNTLTSFTPTRFKDWIIKAPCLEGSDSYLIIIYNLYKSKTIVKFFSNKKDTLIFIKTIETTLLNNDKTI